MYRPFTFSRNFPSPLIPPSYPSSLLPFLPSIPLAHFFLPSVSPSLPPSLTHIFLYPFVLLSLLLFLSLALPFFLCLPRSLPSLLFHFLTPFYPLSPSSSLPLALILPPSRPHPLSLSPSSSLPLALILPPSRPHPPVLSPSSSLPLTLILPPSRPLYSSGAPHHPPFSRGLDPVHDSHHDSREMCHRCEKSRVKRSEQDKVRF